MTTQSICLSSDQLSAENITGTYVLEHQSSIGLKYTSIKGVKITYSDKITNFLGGAWRIAKDSSPYTLYYAHSDRGDSVPLSGWQNIDNIILQGSVLNQPCSGSVISPSISPSITPSITPSVTPSVTPSIPIKDVGLTHTHNALTETKVVRGRPTINHVSHLNLKSEYSYTILLTGYSLNYTTSVYLSCNNDAYEMKYYDEYNTTEFPPFSGKEISYTNISENELIVTIPASPKSTLIDIIVANPAGYGKLTPEYDPISTKWVEDNIQHSMIDIN